MTNKESIINEFKERLESWCFIQAGKHGQGPDGPRVIIKASMMEQLGVFMVSVEFPTG